MYHLTAQNERGETFQLTGNPAYDILDIVGTNPPVAAINRSKIAGVDGSKMISAIADDRNIVITLDIKQPCEDNRIRLYDFFRIKQKVRLLYRNKHRNCYIDGYIESIENNPFTQLQQPQISVICPQPYWLDAEETSVIFSSSTALFEFPFSIPSEGIEFSTVLHITEAVINAGDIKTGGIITFRAIADHVINPKFYNLTTSKFIGVDVDMMEGDLITINTMQGEKSIKMVRGTTITNMLSSMTSGSTWLQFEPGDNSISFDAYTGAEKLAVDVSLVKKYQGV